MQINKWRNIKNRDFLSLKVAANYQFRFDCNRKSGLTSIDSVLDKPLTILTSLASTGIPRGSPLSPLLWNILLNDILMNVKSTNAEIICYADDISIICWHYNLEGLKTKLVNTLNYVTQWCRSNKFQLEFQKTVIKPSNEIKILGMKLSNHRFKTKINFTPHINEILHKAHRMKNLLFSLSGKIWGINSNKKSFKTSSSNCVHCLAEIPFLTDFIESRFIKYELDQLSEEVQRTFSPHSPSIINGFLRTRMVDMFSNTSDHFRLFFSLGIPKYFRPDFYNVQFVTGHGNFGDFLFRIGVIDDPGCLCGKRKQDSSHLLLECPIFQNYRNRENIEYKDLFMFVNSKDSYFKFRKFCKYKEDTRDEQALVIQKSDQQHLVSGFQYPGFFWSRLTLTSPLGILTLGFRVIVIDPCLVACDYLVFPFRIRSCHFQHVLTGCKPTQFLLISEESWDEFCRSLFELQIFGYDPSKGCVRDACVLL
ncbi:hypothetical protein LAZ67_1006086 [Cordylochernes scorpioides]|uniref:Reverse transcriptase domain-containing protein n=1 Tax=Cordylochernes scorpioides TaxID=51811 RepID=A0ABY6K3B8_9ARAC|nr:hypothetical protein LAZ67_1006086 [Cordylochernes scorpioides]